ncbi:MAG TPA: transcriptional repressor, partial [Firmicutes bacterium]|nr:transcriptional repressor [Bacillota bacterium]
ARYELAESSKGHHHHLVCTDCNRIIDYDDFIDDEVKLLEQTQKKLSKKYDFNIESHLIQFYGKCAECR